MNNPNENKKIVLEGSEQGQKLKEGLAYANIKDVIEKLLVNDDGIKDSWREYFDEMCVRVDTNR